MCRVCGQPTRRSGYLHRCIDSRCDAVHWNESVLNQVLDDRKVFRKTLVDANDPNGLAEKNIFLFCFLKKKGRIPFTSA